ncbi:MAG: hypothetical protein HOP08_19150 [Cyclobacteriaceae bacterium]|nr:hypothetical protein [Cyclobacteriaceae bacterium]
MTTLEIIIETIGWAGSAAVIAAYALNSYQKIKSDSLVFQLLNLTGGIFLIVYTNYKEAFASTVINVVWVVVAVSALARMIISRKASSNPSVKS